ncbi:nucleoporin Nup98 and Nup96 [Schizosaccharomyces pombe]|uniref:Nucleoporin nup189 n=1 Tax=Schizosaccharomyces pombe (strain 972 / ATCC 24843) TaxID=284812 RepID=NU189_SCHPO|nr:RecName: Full=Nucleoporin nup189; AltName: Full=Nuclear pore protein nup189; Contains: RecName: Full=Nucleoporin nup98; Contains: RecName: Full=Nucleoporin nup96; Flags: Precursor [Schizosaccharomyces pombe 972h-]BAR64199.1 nucleoporins Nup98-Nup96 [Schizosaccharomyces pombe]
MFGQNNSSGFGGGTGAFGQNNQQTGGLFGSNSNTPGNTLFGSQNTSTTGFGQNTTQPLFGSNTNGGLFGNRNNTTTTGGTGFGMSSGTGMFGQSNTPAFGGTNNATNPSGGGLFGSNTANNNANTGTSFSFGSNAGSTGFGNTASNTGTGGGLFGSQNNAGNTAGNTGFGSQGTGGGLFGSSTTPATTNAFGTSGFVSSNANAVNGTANPPYAVTSEKDPQTNGTSVFQSITCMPAYRSYSFEELRLQDYNQGRRFGNASSTNTTSAFGSTPAFGASTTPFGQNLSGTTNNATPFGTSNATNTTPGSGLFGGGSAFGSNTTNTGFGSGTNNASGGLFGQNNNTTSTPSTGLFGGSTFNQQKPAFSGFGSTTNTTNTGTGTGLFGSNNATNTGTGQTTGGLFGGAATGTGTGFGSSTGGFGSNTNNQPNSGTMGTGLFGFGANNNTANNNTAPTSTFGGNNSSNFSFGANNNAATKPSGFGFGSTTTTPASGGFSFGQNANNAPKPAFGSTATTAPKPAGTGLFGGLGAGANTNTATNATGTGGSLFGNANTAGSNMFGSANSSTPGTGLFGSTQTNNATSNTGTGLFGSNNANTTNTGGSLFNKPSTTTGGLFGNTTAQQPSTTTSGLFGASNTNNQAQTSNFGTGLFGGSQAGQQQQPLQASIDQNPYGNNPLFSSTTSQVAPTSIQEPIASPLTSKPTPKKAASLPQFWLSPRSHNTARLASISSFAKSAVMNSTSASGKPKSLHLFDSLNDDVLLSADAFTPRQNIKKLVITHKISKDDILQNGVKNGNDAKSDSKVQEKAPQNEADGSLKKDEHVVLSDDYWMKPSIEELSKYPKEKLCSVHQFSVGRTGYGQVAFLKPVDLSGFEKLEDIPGKVVVFERKICAVYPVEGSSPPLGEGLNVPAIITLEKTWPLSRETREPIKDPQNPRYIQHVKRLHRIKDTEFIDFNDGKWIFKVQHFSRYGLLDDEEEENDMSSTSNEAGNLKKYDQPNLKVSGKNDSFVTHHTPGAFPNDSKNKELNRHFLKVDDSAPLDDTFMSKKVKLDFSSDSNVSERGDYDDNAKKVDEVISIEKVDGYSKENNVPLSEDDLSNSSESSNESVYSLVEESDASLAADNMDIEDISEESDREELSSMRFGAQDFHGLVVTDNWRDQLNLSVQRSALIKAAFPESQSNANLKNSRGIYYNEHDLVTDIFGNQNLDTDRPWQSLDKPGAFIPSKFHFTANGSCIYVLKSSDVKIRSIYDFIPTKDPNGTKLLEYQLDQTEVYLDLSGTHAASPRSSMTVKPLSLCSSGYESIVWDLTSILFDPKNYSLPSELSSEAREVLYQKLVRESLSEWITKTLEHETTTLAKEAETSEERIYILLTGNLIGQACEEAVQSQNNRLSTLIPLVNSDVDIQQEVKQQLEEWRKHGDLPFINKFTRLIFELLSGNTDIAEGCGTKGDEDYVQSIPITKNMTWLRAFGLKLWYNTDISIGEAMQLYVESLQKFPEIMQKPIATSAVQGIEVYDIIYLLLKAYAMGTSLEELTIPESAKCSPLNYRVVWQLAIYLSKARSLCDFSDRVVDINMAEDLKPISVHSDQLTLAYASQLEASGQWLWSLFVLLHLENVETRTSTITSCLARNLRGGLGAGAVEMIEKLCIPESWLNEAKALYARYVGDHLNELYFLQEAALYEDAHKVLLDTLAPQAVISGNKTQLKKALEGFNGQTDGLASWRFGGQIYSDYLDLLEGNFDANQELKLFTLRKISVALKELNATNLLQKAALHKISRFVNALCNEESLTDAICNLPLPLADSLANLQNISVQF